MPARPSKKSRAAANTRAKTSGRKRNRWVATVTTDPTHPQKGLFTKDPATIARSLASEKVSPKGPASGIITDHSLPAVLALSHKLRIKPNVREE